MGRAHGTGQGCYRGFRPTTGTCQECVAYMRTRRKRESVIPGTYAFNAAHGIGRAGELSAARVRTYKGTLKGFMAAIRDNASQRGVV